MAKAKTYTQEVSGTLTYHTGTKGTDTEGKVKITGSLTVAIMDGTTQLHSSSGSVEAAGVELNAKSDSKQVITADKWKATVSTDASGNLAATLKIDYDTDHVWSTSIANTLQLGGSYPGRVLGAEG